MRSDYSGHGGCLKNLRASRDEEFEPRPASARNDAQLCRRADVDLRPGRSTD
jgi:hypothetical protein